MNTFWSTEVNFSAIPTYEGSFSVSDTVFDHSQGFSESSDVKKPSQPSVLWQKTAREHLILSCHKGVSSTKIALKKDLDASISPLVCSVLVAGCPGGAHRVLIWPQTTNIDQEIIKWVTQSCFQKSKISVDFFSVVDPRSHLWYVFQQGRKFPTYNYSEMFRKQR